MARDPPKLRLDPSTTRTRRATLPEDFRFTTKGNDLYTIELGWPAKGEAVIQSLGTTVGARKISAVTLLGSSGNLQFRQEPDGLHIQMPAQAPGKYAYAFRLAFGN